MLQRPSPAYLAHAFEDDFGVVHHVVGAALEREWQDGGEFGALLAVDAACGNAEVVAAGGLRAINAGAPLDHVEIKLEDAPLAEDQLGHRDERELGALSKDGAAGAEEEIFHQLLRDGGTAANFAAFHIAFGGEFNRVPIEAVMLVEARVFGGDHGVLEIGRDSAEWNEIVAFVVRLAMDP